MKCIMIIVWNMILHDTSKMRISSKNIRNSCFKTRDSEFGIRSIFCAGIPQNCILPQNTGFPHFEIQESRPWSTGVTGTFFRMKQILFLAKVITFWNCENTYTYIARANFNRDFSKINFKICLLLQFSRKTLETW